MRKNSCINPLSSFLDIYVCKSRPDSSTPPSYGIQPRPPTAI